MKKITFVIALFVALIATEASSQQLKSFFDEADAFFKTYVSNGKVDYATLHKNPTALNNVMTLAKDISIGKVEAKTAQSFWINAYNISVIRGIIDAYPIKSPLDKKGFFDKTKYELAGTKITLNDIENKKLRAAYGDARFHFVLVCGAKGCPPIIAKAYTPAILEQLLEKQTILALNNPKFIQVSGKKVAFSEIFKWYKEDFVKEGTEIDFLNKYRKEKVPANAKVTYYSYDWRLNAK